MNIASLPSVFELMARMKVIQLIALAAFCLPIAGMDAQAPRKPALPAGPVELLKCLPGAPAGWQLKESKANSFYNEWLVSQATRLFEMPAKETTPSETPPPPSVTRLRLTDTGYYPVLFADFEDFKPGTIGTLESLFVGTYPAHKMKLADGERLRILINNRFVIEVETHHQAANSGLSWLQLFDLVRLIASPATAVEKLPNPLRVVTVDEMDPRLDTSYEISSSSDEDLAKARKRKR